MQCNCVAVTDQVGGLVEVDGVLESDLGGLVVAAANAAETNAAAAVAVAGGEQVEECDQERDTCGAKWHNGVAGFYQAVVAVHPTRLLHAVFDEGKSPVGTTGNLQGNKVVLENGIHNGIGDEEMESSDDEMVDQEEEDEDDEEDPETDEYTFVEISVYEVLEVSEKVNKCEIVVEEEKPNNSECVAVITGIAEESLTKDGIVGEPKKMEIQAKEGDQIKAFLPPSTLTNGNVKRRRGRSNNGRRKRAGGRRR